MDALTLLTADHNRVRGLFARFTAAKDAHDVDTMTEVASRIANELEVHTTIEEQVFYPWARGLSKDIAEIVDEGVEEHHVVDVLLGEIAGLEPATDEWTAKLTVVIENVEHHAEEEENEMFPQIRSAADGDSLNDVGADLEAKKAELGAPVLAHKIDLSTAALKKLATDQQIPGRSSMSHDELAATVSPS
jgi:iron-sulfur cluster repair protein YtfE (RIC family)